MILPLTKLLSGIFAASLLVTLVGCSTEISKNEMPPSDMSMSDIYNQSTGDADSNSIENLQLRAIPMRNQPVNYQGYTRTALNETHTQFKQIPNPSVPIFIFPHLSQAGASAVPIPAYSTSFYLYQKNHYAMVEEVY